MATVTVMFPVCFDTKDIGGLKIDQKRIKKGDEDYIEEIRDVIKGHAIQYIGDDRPFITDSEIPELME